jgi:uncharacterized membrane protein
VVRHFALAGPGAGPGLIIFFLVYTFVFNLAFDKVFGLPASALPVPQSN